MIRHLPTVETAKKSLELHLKEQRNGEIEGTVRKELNTFVQSVAARWRSSPLKILLIKSHHEINQYYL